MLGHMQLLVFRFIFLLVDPELRLNEMLFLLEKLELDKGGIAYDKKQGMQLTPQLHSVTNKFVSAAGDCVRGCKNAQNGEAMTRTIIRNALFFDKHNYDLYVPWVIHTDP